MNASADFHPRTSRAERRDDVADELSEEQLEHVLGGLARPWVDVPGGVAADPVSTAPAPLAAALVA